MSDTDESSPQRFPFAAAVFCAACVGVAAWLFFRWSYAWDVTPCELDVSVPASPPAGAPAPWPDERWMDAGVREILKWLPGDVRGPHLCPFLGKYVRVRGDNIGPSTWIRAAGVIVLRDPSEPAHRVCVRLGDAAAAGAGGPRAFSGRVVLKHHVKGQLSDYYLAVDTTRSRWTGESVAGLVVGAMGVLVFGMTFRHWLAQRRRFRGSTDPTEAEAAT